MPEFVTCKSKVPEFAVFPITKRLLEEVLHDISQQRIMLTFFRWRSESVIRKGHAVKVRRNGVAIELLSAHYLQGKWSIWVFPVRKEHKGKIQELMETEGFVRLRKWFVEKAPVEDPNSPVYETATHFDVLYDGQKLMYRLTG